MNGREIGAGVTLLSAWVMWRAALMLGRCKFVVLLAVGLVGPLCGPLVAAEKPNIVYIMSDELGYYELSCMGNPHIQTPRIDQMAREGIRFTNS